MVALPEPLAGHEETYRLSCSVSSADGRQVIYLGWAPCTLPLDSWQCTIVGYWALARNGALTDVHQSNATVARPTPPKQGRLPQGGVISTTYDRHAGTISFAWPGKSSVLAYTQVPREPRLFPVVFLNNEGDTVSLLDS